jgi:hypothetical protein
MIVGSIAHCPNDPDGIPPQDLIHSIHTLTANLTLHVETKFLAFWSVTQIIKNGKEIF